MEEKNMKETPLMGEEEFENYMHESIEENIRNNIYPLNYFYAVSKFRSIKRAIRRGNVSLQGEIYPRRPFNNRANTSERKGVHSRKLNESKKEIYEQFRNR